MPLKIASICFFQSILPSFSASAGQGENKSLAVRSNSLRFFELPRCWEVLGALRGVLVALHVPDTCCSLVLLSVIVQVADATGVGAGAQREEESKVSAILLTAILYSPRAVSTLKRCCRCNGNALHEALNCLRHCRIIPTASFSLTLPSPGLDPLNPLSNSPQQTLSSTATSRPIQRQPLFCLSFS
jgi:hypothetical protein